ncbi:AI-2E family transporter [Desulfogranum marinum]|uniref:AI-2E family transporter n=1 Tax=Desulfogranum marinum TaxID=453220 RepID=UPI001962D39D|nr:AI-2E family transporter [Desulfogranum marinum]MBM9514392.1 AI-2E family transporter [Desulfogranum marinum]
MNTSDTSKSFQKEFIETVIKICILGTMVLWTLLIIKPFLMPVLWGIIIAVAMEPFIAGVAAMMGGRRKAAAVLFALVVIAALIIPSVKLVASSVDTVQSIATAMEENTLKVPPPPASVSEWPLIGPSLSKTWTQASINLETVLKQYGPQLKTGALTLLGSVGGGVKGVFMFIISVAIAAAFLATAEKSSAAIEKIITRFAGDRGEEITSLATATIRGVMQGVVGVAVIQSVLSVIGMVIVGVPAAGLWAALVLVMAVIQLPPILVLGPVAAWVFTATTTVPAVFFLIWAIVVSASDGILKPLLMGRGVDIPMLVILLGALGGMMLSGIIGLFVGAVVVAISYTLFTAWVDEESDASLADTTDKAE